MWYVQQRMKVRVPNFNYLTKKKFLLHENVIDVPPATLPFLSRGYNNPVSGHPYPVWEYPYPCQG